MELPPGELWVRGPQIRVVFIEAIPRSPSGKILRRMLKNGQTSS